MVTNTVEAAGYALVVVFLAACWPPLALLGSGVLLVVYANTRRPTKGRTAAAVGAAWTSARTAWRNAERRDELARRAA